MIYDMGWISMQLVKWTSIWVHSAWPPNRIIMWRYSIKLNNLNLIMCLFYSQCADLHQVFRWTRTPPGISDGWTWFEVCNKDYDIRVIMTDLHNGFIRDFWHTNRNWCSVLACGYTIVNFSKASISAMNFDVKNEKKLSQTIWPESAYRLQNSKWPLMYYKCI